MKGKCQMTADTTNAIIEKEQELIGRALPAEKSLGEFLLYYRHTMMLYESAIKCILTRIDIMTKEHEALGERSPIRQVSSRIKTPQSIYRKLQKKGLPKTIRSMTENLNDVAGIRIICEYIRDIYDVRDFLLSKGVIELIEEKDYIENPKENGYRSLHLIVNVAVPLNNGEKNIKCEIQIRTTAMDSWAGLEHNLRYKKDRPRDERIDAELKLCAAMLAQSDRTMQSIAESLGVFEKNKKSPPQLL